MKIARVLVALLLLLGAAYLGHCALVESGEVAVLETSAGNGAVETTRLWFARHQGRRWLLAGSGDAAWLARVRSDPAVRVQIEGEWASYTAVPVVAERESLLGLMAGKYGLADRWVRFLVGREAVPVRLDPR